MENKNNNRIFWDWFKKEYLQFRSLDMRNNVSEFAKSIPMNQATVSAFLNETRGVPTSSKIQKALIDRFGKVASDAMGINDDFDQVDVDISEAPGELRDRFFTATNEINEVLREHGLLAESEEGRSVIRETFAKHGLSVTIKENSG